MHITLEQARCFSALIESGSYQSAAELLHKSHSAIVYAIQCFEDQTGLALLNRTGYRTTLTPAGLRVYRQCRELLQSAAHLEQICADLNGGWEPSLRLVYDGVLSAEPFLDVFELFKNQKIPTTLDIYADFLHGVEKSFVDLDAELMISVLPPKMSPLQAVALKPLTLWLVASRSHELSQTSRPWSVRELMEFNFLTVRGAGNSLQLGTRELEEVSTFHMSDFSLKKMAILRGTGFGWLPHNLIRTELKRGLLKPVRSELANKQELRPHLYHRKKRSLGRAAQILVEQLRN